MTTGVRRARVADRAAAARGITAGQHSAKMFGSRSGAGSATPADRVEDDAELRAYGAPEVYGMDSFVVPDPDGWQ